MSILKLENLELKKEMKRLKQLVEYDELCQIYNKRATEEKIAQELLTKDKGVLLVIDIDRFKFINDYFGHLIGDDALRKISHTISLAVRQEEAIVGRTGGDEFVVYLKFISKKAVITKTIARIKEGIEHIQLLKNGSPSLSVSIFSDIARAGDTYESLFDRADQKLVKYKRTRQNAIKDFRQLNLMVESNYYDFETFCMLKQTLENVPYHLLTITMVQRNDDDYKNKDNEMFLLYQCICSNLREEDFFTQFSCNQYLLLCEVNEEKNLLLIKERIVAAYKRCSQNKHRIKISKFGSKQNLS